MSQTMKDAVLNQAVSPEVPIPGYRQAPQPANRKVLIRAKTVGVKRSELLMRQGHSQNVRLPRVFGIKSVGTVADALDGKFLKVPIIVAAMSGTGRDFYVSWAECTIAPCDDLVKANANYTCGALEGTIKFKTAMCLETCPSAIQINPYPYFGGYEPS